MQTLECLSGLTTRNEKDAEYKERIKGVFKPEEWNKFKVVCKGSSIMTFVNGKLVAEVEHKQSLEGHFGIQHHGKGGTVSFRNMRARKL